MSYHQVCYTPIYMYTAQHIIVHNVHTCTLYMYMYVNEGSCDYHTTYLDMGVS